MTNSTRSLAVSILEFGAVGDGQTPDTGAIQKALDFVGRAGGGVVHIPPGTFLTGTIHLRSKTTLEFLNGSVLLGSPNIKDYDSLVAGHNKDRQKFHLIVAQDAEQVVLKGHGKIDGNGPAFWHPPKGPKTWIKEKEHRPSPMIDIVNCRDVYLQDLTITNSPGWTVHFHHCDRVFVRGIQILNPLFGPNTDGLDINGCRDVVVSDCNISTCDDAIVLKTSPDSRSLERVIVTNCTIETKCAALKLGATESYHDMRQITFSNCVVHHSSRAVALYSFNGAVLEDIAVSNIVCDTRSGLVFNRPVHFDLRQANPNVRVGTIRNVMISNFIARTDGRLVLTAADGGKLQNITLRDIQLIYPLLEDPDPLARDAKSAQFSRNCPEARVARAAVVADTIENLVIQNLQIIWPTSPNPPPDWVDEGPRLQNGGDGTVPDRPKNFEGDFPPFQAIWAKDVQGGLLDVPLAGSNRKGLASIHLDRSNIHVRE